MTKYRLFGGFMRPVSPEEEENICGGDPCAAKPIQSDRITYSGPNLPCTGIHTCDDLSVILQKLDEIICNLQDCCENPVSTTSTTTTTHTTAVPIPYRASISTGDDSGYNFSNEVNIPVYFGVRTYVTAPSYIDPDGNDGYVYISIPEGRSYLLEDVLGFPLTAWMVSDGTDNRVGYHDNRIYENTQSFDTSYGGQFFLTIY